MGARRSEFVDEQHPLLYKPLNLNDYAHAHMASIAQRKEVVPIYPCLLAIVVFELNVLFQSKETRLLLDLFQISMQCVVTYIVTCFLLISKVSFRSL